MSLGLLRIVRRVPRKGRAIRTYRAVADSFFAPLHSLPDTTLEELLENGDADPRRRVARGMVAAMREAPTFLDWGVHVTVGDAGDLSVSIGPAEPDWQPARLLEGGAPAVVSSWVPLRLGFEDAKALQRELFDLIGRYSARTGPQEYLLGIALTPAPEE